MAKDDFNMKKEYEKLRAKYKDLPPYDSINNDFELDFLDSKKFITRRIRRRLNEKAIFYCKLIENIIYPNVQSTITAYEASFFSDEYKEELVKLHKKLMVFERSFLVLDVNGSTEAEDVKLIKALIDEWPKFKKKMDKVVKKMESSWKKDIEDDGEKYFG